jgi:hypothetical protein
VTADQEDARGDAEDEMTPGAVSPDPLLPDQPRDAERPMPLRAAPERTRDPGDWDVSTAESSRPRSLEDPGEPVRDPGIDLRDHAPGWVEEQSSYSTDLSQGATHPQGSIDEDDEGEPEAQPSP